MLPFCANPGPHSEHLNDFSTVWVLICLVRSEGIKSVYHKFGNSAVSTLKKNIKQPYSHKINMTENKKKIFKQIFSFYLLNILTQAQTHWNNNMTTIYTIWLHLIMVRYFIPSASMMSVLFTNTSFKNCFQYKYRYVHVYLEYPIYKLGTGYCVIFN